MNILITGSYGFIGSNLKQYLEQDYTVSSLSRNIVDLNNLNQVQQWFDNKFFDVVIHTAVKGGSRLNTDNGSIIDSNIQMYLNLLSCQDHYNKFIHLGSGAEIHKPFSPYGLSKRAIFESIQDKPNFYSLRIFALFNENELDTRFIKSNIMRYIKQENLLIHQNHLMDFMYFDDFVQIMNYYIQTKNPPKNTDCVYPDKYTLLDIANMINTLSNYKVNINTEEFLTIDSAYTGVYNNLDLDFKGLYTGIKETYRKLMQ